MTGRAEDLRRVQPDPANPQIVNGGFEQQAEDGDFIPGWYYERQFELTADKLAPEGGHFVTFRNQQQGMASHLMQGFPIDGRKVSEIELSAWVRFENAAAGRQRDEVPLMAVSFYDENRKDLGVVFLGPFLGTENRWHRVRDIRPVPLLAREGILRIGLFGATGEISFDRVQMEPVRR
jgi:protein-L-isoaspartate(D-aspartate) O-methyltransferase